jgi:hypothetical protein
LLYHIPDVFASVGGIRPAIDPDLVWEIDIHFFLKIAGGQLFSYIPVTLVWVIVISSGVPLGAQMAWLSNSNTGIPLEVMRVAAVTHWAVTHGSGLPTGVVNGHAAIV